LADLLSQCPAVYLLSFVLPRQSTTETKTRGTRTTPSDRLIATGPYIILLHNTSSSAPTQNPTSLVFRTTLPVEPGEVQKAFRIGKEGAFSLSVKNPKMPNTGRGSGPSGVPGGLRGDKKAEFPKERECRVRRRLEDEVAS
jgi:hypothetical protein